MTIKVGTNQTNQADCPTPIEPDVTTTKADDLESLKKATGPGLVPEHLGESGFMDTVKSGLDFAKSGLDFADKAVDLVRDIPIIGDSPTIIAADKATDVALEIYEQASKVPGALGEVLYESVETKERILERTNDLLADTFGEDAPRIAVKPEDICWDTTFDTFTNPANLSKGIAVINAVVIETAAEAHPNLKPVLESKAFEVADQLLETSLKYGPLLNPFTALPTGIFLAATGETPLSAAYKLSKETIADLADPVNQRDLFKVANGPSLDEIKALKPNETFTTKMKLDLEVIAGAGAKGSTEVDRTVGRRENGDYFVSLKVDNTVAAGLGLTKVLTGCLVGETHTTFEFNIKNPELAASLGRGDFFGSILEFGKNPELPGVEHVKLDAKAGLELSAGAVSLTSVIGASVDVAKLEGQAYREHKAILDLSVDLGSVAFSRADDKLKSGMDALEMMRENPFSNSAELGVKYGLNVNLEKPTFELVLSAEAKGNRVNLSGEVKVTVDIVKAAKAMGVTVEELKRSIDNKEVDPARWWESLPDDIVTIDTKFETKFQEKKYGASAAGLSAERYKTVTDTMTGGEMINFLRGEEARDQQLSRLRS